MSIDDAPRNEHLAWWGSLMVRWRLPVLVADLALMVGGLYLIATRLEFDASPKALLAEGSVARESLTMLEESFGTDEVFLVLVDGDVFTLPFLERLRALHEDLARLDVPLVTVDSPKNALPTDEWGDFGDEGWGAESGGSVIESVTSLVNTRDSSWQGDTLNVAGLLDDWPTVEELPALRARVLAEKKWVGNLVGADGRHAVLVVQNAKLSGPDMERVYGALLDVAEAHDAPGFHPQVGGPAALYTEITVYTGWEFLRLGLAEMVVLFACLWWMFRRPLGIVGPLGAITQAVVWTLALMILLGKTMTVISAVLWPFLLTVCIGETIHVQSVFHAAQRRGMSPPDAVAYALGTTGGPVLFTTLTSMVGLLSFEMASLPAIKELGRFAAFGLLVGLFQTLTWLPAMLSFAGSVPAESTRTVEDLLARVGRWFDGLSRGRRSRTLVLVGSAVAVVVCAAIGSQVRVAMDSKQFLPADAPSIRALEALDAHVGGTNTMSLVIEVPEGGDVRDRDLLLGLEGLERHLLAWRDPANGQPLVSNAYGTLDVVREATASLHGGDPAWYRIPDTQRGVNDAFTVFETGGRDALRSVMTVDARRALLAIRLVWRDTAGYRPLLQDLHTSVERFVGDRARVYVTGTVPNHESVESALIGDLSGSFGAATLVVTALMVVMLRDLKLGLLAMIPNVAPMAMVFAQMVVFDIPIDVQNVLIPSIVIGIAVDDTIHFMHQFKAHYDVSGSVDRALDHAYGHAGGAMVLAGLVLIIGFGTLALGGMPSSRVFAFLAASAVSWALLAELLISPALLRAVYRDVPRA